MIGLQIMILRGKKYCDFVSELVLLEYLATNRRY